MDDFDFPGFDCEPLRFTHCNCGNGYCEAHGTFHFPDATEALERERRADVHGGTRGGNRIIRKRLGGKD